MSRLGKLPISLPTGTEAKIENNIIIVKGPKGELKQELNSLVKVEIVENEIIATIKDKTDKKEKSFWGLYRSLINNMVIGVSEGFQKKLEINGVGYRSSIAGQKITLTLGFSHPVEFVLPAGISGQIEGNVITISGADKQLVGELTAQIRKLKKPEPYKGKGIKYIDEVIRRKEGKTAGKGE